MEIRAGKDKMEASGHLPGYHFLGGFEQVTSTSFTSAPKSCSSQTPEVGNNMESEVTDRQSFDFLSLRLPICPLGLR